LIPFRHEKGTVNFANEYVNMNLSCQFVLQTGKQKREKQMKKFSSLIRTFGVRNNNGGFL